jgi:PAS domain S-box-containing protein
MREEEERALRATRMKRFRAHLDLAERAAHFGYWRADLTDDTFYWSPGMYRMLDEDPGERKPDAEWLFEQITAESRATAEAAVAAAIKNRSSFAYRTYTRDPRKTAQIVDTQGEVEIADDGRTVAVLGVCHDVTERVRAEEARQSAHEMYRVMTTEASDIILLFGPDRKILFASEALGRVIGRSIAEIEHGNWMKHLHPDDAEQFRKTYDPPKQNETLTSVYRLQHGAGHYVWLEVVTRGRFTPEGIYQGYISVARDVTLRKQHEFEMKAAQERAEMANRAKSQFLANMSHELRTPLNAIIGFTDMMRQGLFGALGDPRYTDYATLIYDSGQLLLDLISDMLDMARIEAGKLELNIERVDLAGTIEDATRLLRDRANSNGVALRVAADDAVPSLLADRRAVKQVLLNLLSNAIKFTPSGGHVVVSAAATGDVARICVADDGIGIPASEIARLGKPFEQVCGDPMLAKSGTGLGLALVRALVERHGGALSIASTEGVGTEVSVTFPLVPAKRAAA